VLTGVLYLIFSLLAVGGMWRWLDKSKRFNLDN